MKLKPTLLAPRAAGALAVTGVGIASAATPTLSPPPATSSSTSPGVDQAGPGETPSAADVAEPGDQADVPGQADTPDNEAAEPAGEKSDGADGPRGHADPPGNIDHHGGPQEQ